MKCIWNVLKVNRLLACKHRRILLIYRMNCYSPSSYIASVANTKHPFLGHSDEEDTLAESPSSFFCTERLPPWCASSLREVAVSSYLESLKDIKLLLDQFTFVWLHWSFKQNVWYTEILGRAEYITNKQLQIASPGILKYKPVICWVIPRMFQFCCCYLKKHFKRPYHSSCNA